MTTVSPAPAGPWPDRTPLARIAIANRANGHHWFDPDTIRLFASQFPPRLIAGDLFWSSERHPDGDDSWVRRFTVRRAMPNGAIETVGDFGAYPTLGAALEATAYAVGDLG